MHSKWEKQQVQRAGAGVPETDRSPEHGGQGGGWSETPPMDIPPPPPPPLTNMR